MLEKRIEILKIESHPMRGGWIEIGSTSILLAVSKPSHPMRGGWIEIVFAMLGSIRTEPSHPMRGGWIEILMCVKHTTTRQSHPMRGGWIEIWEVRTAELHLLGGPTPCGVGGLKSASVGGFPSVSSRSHPMRGGWIEIN